jgi:LacI family transcriptional regulator
VMEVLREHNREIPRDMSVVGFDDISHASLVYPKLTTVRQPLYEMGETAAKLLLEWLQKGELPPQHIQLETQLVIRDSCCPPRQFLERATRSFETRAE